MMKYEFERLIGRDLAQQDWLNAETIYMHHPAIDDCDGKTQMKAIYTLPDCIRPAIIADMLVAARKAELGEAIHRNVTSAARAAEIALKDLSDAIATLHTLANTLRNSGEYARQAADNFDCAGRNASFESGDWTKAELDAYEHCSATAGDCEDLARCIEGFLESVR